MAAEALIFYILSAIAVVGALGVVLARNPLHSAVGLALSFVNLAAIYVLLHAEFLAVAQVIVYAGAILVLVLFVIMLVQPEELPQFHTGRPLQITLAAVLGLVLLGEVAVAILSRQVTGQPGPWTPAAVQAVGGNVQALGQVLYSGYMLPIQTTAILLLTATIGALVLARPEPLRLPFKVASRVNTISLGHPRGTDVDGSAVAEPAALPDGALKPEAGDRHLVMAKSGDEYVDRPVWGERRES